MGIQLRSSNFGPGSMPPCGTEAGSCWRCTKWVKGNFKPSPRRHWMRFADMRAIPATACGSIRSRRSRRTFATRDKLRDQTLKGHSTMRTLVAEHGFWDYTTPGSGGMERYTRDDHLLLLDDMAEARMNSLCILVKWLTTGYRSRLPFVDQHPSNAVTASDNQLLRDVIDEASKRGIETWLGANVNVYPTGKMKTEAWSTARRIFHVDFPFEISSYDLDTSEVQEIGRAHVELQSLAYLVCRLLL